MGIKIIKLTAISAILILSSACSKVPAGYVGVKVNNYGSEKGVKNEVVGPGRYFTGFNTSIYKFPTFTQTYVWTKSVDEGSAIDESITFQSKEGLNINADVGISYEIQPEHAADVFQKYRRGVEELTDTVIRSKVRNAFTQTGALLPIEDLYSTKKSEMLEYVTKAMKAELSPIGIIVEDVYLVGELRLPDSVVKSINSKISATQDAQKVENQVRSAKAEAEKTVAIAQGEAQAMEIKGKAIRENPEILKQAFLEKWNGVMPQVVGGNDANILMNLSK